MNLLTAYMGNPFEFDFNLIPIFKAYEEAAYYHIYPTPELVIDIYDLRVDELLRELHYTLSPSEARELPTHPWQVSALPPDKEKNISEMIGMKPCLEMRELAAVMDTFCMSHIDDYGILKHFPIKEVW